MIRLSAALLLSSALVAGAAQAAPPRAETAKRAAVLDALAACRKEADSALRLACYDKAAGALDEAEAKGQIVVLDKEQVKTVRRQAFGFDVPSFSFFSPKGRAGPDEAVDKVVYTVEFAGGAEGHAVFRTTDGVTWVQTDDELPRPAHKGSELRVRRAALGSYFCNVDGQRAVRCQRRN